MKMTIDASIMHTMFRNYNRDYFSFTGLETLLEYYDEIDPNMEFDPIAICCDCSEFGDNCALTFADMINDYGYIMEDAEVFTADELAEALADHTTVLHVANGNYIVFCF